MRTTSIRTKLLAGFLAVVAVSITLGAYSAWSFDRINSGVEKVVATQDQVLKAGQVRFLAQSLTVGALAYPLTEGADAKAEVVKGVQQSAGAFGPVLDGFEAGLTEEQRAEMADEIASVREAWGPLTDAMFTLVGLPTSTAAGSGATLDSATAYSNILAAVEELNAALAESGKAQQKASHDVYASARLVLIVALVLAAAGGTGLALLIANGIVGPLRRTVRTLSAVADGDLTVAGGADTARRDEVGELARAVDTTVASLREVLGSTARTAGTLATAAGTLEGGTARIAAASAEAVEQAAQVAAAADQVSASVRTVAAGTDEMGESISEISRNANDAVAVAGEAVAAATATDERVRRLSESSREIGDVVKVITSIAEQTNLLALNATIEAARAGEAGKGFAVVASEVKDLAQETARATEDIVRRVETIQTDTTAAADTIARITEIIDRIATFQTSIASAVEEQTATTGEASRSVGQAAQGTDEIAAKIGRVAQATGSTDEEVRVSAETTGQIKGLSAELQTLVARFRY
ncbi:methyl-accepting chemotaxis protein [Motilibacter aurantiacus]|uniref:methyl-accepting chemotaxis protein n=1 Tax=Motilibacter aurantiacus TaxID=2714955 RepID=UPI00140D79F9|nr:methyl-accepting chemotaxis protein [Motilibacter aurantiacus]NHC43897.1 methyl-accepting chemotaxis protein [Motilibacter aurantiacus]